MRTSSPEVLVELDRSRPRRLRVQVEDTLREAIRSGRLAPGAQLPSTRALAADLGITRGVILAAYDQLVAEGYLTSRPGSGIAVNAVHQPSATRPAPRLPGPRFPFDFRTGLPDPRAFPRAAWVRATRTAMQTMPDELLGYPDPCGVPHLREALAGYLGRVRGVSADPEHIVICGGFSQAVCLAARAVIDAGHHVVAFEDPGHLDARAQVEWVGGQHVAIDVDAEGLRVDHLRRSSAGAVVVTPAHQYPTGVLLSARRRTALVEWARGCGGYVIEDDYDAEYRYDRHPVGALQGVAQERVIYVGTLSKSLAPGLRLGWLVVPAVLVESIVAARLATDLGTSTILQATFAAFLERGDLDHHLRRSRRTYCQRRDALVAALARWLPDATPSGIAAGLHLLLTLPPGLDEEAVADAAAASGVGVYPLRRFRTITRPDAAPALLLGYGALTPTQIDGGIRLLAEATARL